MLINILHAPSVCLSLSLVRRRLSPSEKECSNIGFLSLEGINVPHLHRLLCLLPLSVVYFDKLNPLE